MEKKYAFILSILFTLVLSNLYILHSLDFYEYEEVFISRVIDGDTLELSDGRNIRLANINAPEKNQPNAHLSKEYLESFINSSLMMETLGNDKYGRHLARLYAESYINLEMIKLGLASKFLVHDGEKTIFLESEINAIRSGKGIWAHSRFYNCFSTDIDKYNELVKFTVICPNIDMKGWTLKDESRKIFKFSSSPSNIFLIYSSSGNSTNSLLFWNSKENIWNDDSDALYLFDKEGKIAHYDSY